MRKKRHEGASLRFCDLACFCSQSCLDFWRKSPSSLHLSLTKQSDGAFKFPKFLRDSASSPDSFSDQPLHGDVVVFVVCCCLFPSFLGFYPTLTRRPPVLSEKRHPQLANAKINKVNKCVRNMRKRPELEIISASASEYSVFLPVFLLLTLRSSSLYSPSENPETDELRPLWKLPCNTWLCLST